MKIENIPTCYCGLSSMTLPSAFEESLSYQEQICFFMKKLNEVIDFTNEELSETIIKYINDNFNNIMMNSVYEESTETLILSLTEGGNI